MNFTNTKNLIFSQSYCFQYLNKTPLNFSISITILLNFPKELYYPYKFKH